MTTEEKLIRDIETLRESIRQSGSDLRRGLTDPASVLKHTKWCIEELESLKEQLAMELELADAAAEFVRYFESVFDNDWDHTKSMIQEPGGRYIDGTFANPGVPDEENNWSNRARILEAYRRLKALLEARELAR